MLYGGYMGTIFPYSLVQASQVKVQRIGFRVLGQGMRGATCF